MRERQHEAKEARRLTHGNCTVGFGANLRVVLANERMRERQHEAKEARRLTLGNCTVGFGC